MPVDNGIYPDQQSQNDENRCKDFFGLSRDEMMRLMQNMFADCFWGPLSALSINLKCQKTTEFWPTTLAQITYSIPPSFLASIFYLCALRYKKDSKIPDAALKTAAGFLSLIGGMLAFNSTQSVGSTMFSRWGVTDKNAGYAVAPLIGLSEGITQTVLYDVILWIFGEPETKERYQLFRIAPCASGFLLLMNILTSSISGTAWQIIYNLFFPNCVNTPNECVEPNIKNLLGVAFSVAMGALLMSYFGGAIYKCFAFLLQPTSVEVGENQRRLLTDAEEASNHDERVFTGSASINP